MKKLLNTILESSPARLIPLSFLFTILIGTALLCLPFASVSHTPDLMTALFTATTSVCVTGLVVVDTFSYWTLFGKIIILILIQIGGLGVVTTMSFLMLALHKKFSLHGQLLILDSFNLKSLHGLMVFLKRVVLSTFLVEGIGAVLYLPVFLRQFGPVEAVWQAVFTSISAFCNAGIDIIGPSSLIPYQYNVLMLCTTMFLIVSGGLGYIVWFDLAATIRNGIRKKYSAGTIIRKFSEHTKLVLTATIFLIFGGALVVFLAEYSNPETIGNMSLGGKILNSIFQSVTFRTAGFAAVPQGGLRDGTVVFGCLLMFIGGSPVGTAGGVKTVVIAVLFMNAVSYILSGVNTVVFNRNVADELIRKAHAIVTVAFAGALFFLIALSLLEPVSLSDAAYEVVSAICTVGLSRGITSSLHASGKIIIMICMYLGRIGPISMALFFSSNTKSSHLRRADGNFIVG